jgi:hypothetical protein
MAGIQFFGVAEVVEQYNDYDVDCWAVFEGKDLCRAGDDDDTLTKYLSKLQHHGSAATYLLRVYRSVDDCNAITPKTEYSACFKFKLNEGGSVSGMGVTRYGGVDPLTAKLQSVVSEEVGKVLDKKLGRDDDDDKPSSFMDGVIGLVNQPDKLVQVLHGLKGLFMQPDAIGQPAGAYAAVTGGMPVQRAGTTFPAMRSEPAPQPVAQAAAPGLSAEAEETMERVAAVLDRLEKADPNTLVNLEMLADLAEKQPAIYQMAVNQLKSMHK